MGVPQNHPLIDGIFHYKPAMGIPIYGTPPKKSPVISWFISRGKYSYKML